MKNARKIFLTVVITLLAIVMLFTLAGCGEDYSATAPMSIEFSFGGDFLETAGVTPYEWRDCLKEEYMGGAKIFVENGVVVLRVSEDFVSEWEELGVTKIEELCREFAALDVGCSIELYANNTAAGVFYDEDISRETVEEYIVQLRKWCAYLQVFDWYCYDKYGLLERIDYIDMSTADETEYGISFEKLVCEYYKVYGFSSINHVFYADGTVEVYASEGDVNTYETFTITEDQVQTIIDTLRRYKVWIMDLQYQDDFIMRDDTLEDICIRKIFIFDKEDMPRVVECGYGFTSKRFDKIAEIIEEILSSEYPQPAQP